MKTMETNLTEFRCEQCRKLLGKIDGAAEIKCPRCRTMNFARKVREDSKPQIGQRSRKNANKLREE